MTASSFQGERGSSLFAGVGWQLARAGLGIMSAAIGIHQLLDGNGMEGAFSFFLAGTFVLSIVCERALARAQHRGAAVPVSVLILFGSAGAAIGGSVVLGVLITIRALWQ